jgi:hypothetical protein
LFPTKFTNRKGIKGPMGEMKIPLKTNARLVKQRLYRLNPKYKQKVKIELDRKMEEGIIEHNLNGSTLWWSKIRS